MQKHKINDVDYYQADEVDGEINRLMKIVKAVAHIGKEWGYGKFELEESHIKEARRLYEMSEDKQS